MKRLSFALVVAIFAATMLLAVAAQAQPEKIVFATFKQGGQHSGTCDFAGQLKTIYIYGLRINEFYTAVEFRLLLCGCLTPVGWTPGPGINLTNGVPWNGVQLAFFPPANGFFPGLDLWATVFATCNNACGDCGFDQLIFIDEYPISQKIQGTRDDRLRTKFDLFGATTILCPNAISTEETTWGQVKALYGEAAE